MWFHHIAGAAQIIQFRGPEQFTSDFDIALLLSLSYPIVSTMSNTILFWLQVGNGFLLSSVCGGSSQ